MSGRYERRPAVSGDPAPDWDWRLEAACRLLPADMFFPVGSGGLSAESVDAAKEVCSRCAARVQCLQFALETRQEFGIWGGTDEEERRRMLRGARLSGTGIT